MLPQDQRIHTDVDFRRIRKKGKKWQSPSFIGLLLPSKSDTSRLGIIVSTKIGKSVVRKRASRVLRAAFAEVQPQLSHVDLVLIARPHVKHKSSKDVARELDRMIKVWRL